ncbi:MAG: hypothetical protein GWO02_07395, partial [Gammaproteobacteria bacterium]|nr:hypothetical protein [Gammaproteobacteria bacterium]
RAIRNAIAEARARLRAERCYDPCRFAELFIRHDGIQTPGPPVARDDRRTVAEALLHALRGGARTHA